MTTQEKGDLLLAVRRQGAVMMLPPRLLIRLSGKDHLRYLNGQVTNDLLKLKPGTSQQSCLLTPKGRLVALLQVSLGEKSVILETDLSLTEIVVERLKRYIISDDVTLEVIPEPETVHLFKELSHHLEVEQAPGIAIDRLGWPGKDLEVKVFSSLSMSARSELLPSDLVEVLRIEQKIPMWGYELNSETLPPEAQLEASSINYEKGCYLGQEVISRLKSVGHVNRLLCSFFAEEEITRGMELFSPEEISSKIGFLTSTALQFDSGRWIAIGYLKRECINSGSSFLAKDPKTGITKKITLK